MLCLEHFLKKVGDKLGALANGLGLVGALLGTNVVAAEWVLVANVDPGSAGAWIDGAGQLSTLLLTAALVLFGIGYVKHRLAPVGWGLGLGLGACGWALGVATGTIAVVGVGSLVLALSSAWVGWRLFRTPALWHQQFLS